MRSSNRFTALIAACASALLAGVLHAGVTGGEVFSTSHSGAVTTTVIVPIRTTAPATAWQPGPATDRGLAPAAGSPASPPPPPLPSTTEVEWRVDERTGRSSLRLVVPGETGSKVLVGVGTGPGAVDALLGRGVIGPDGAFEIAHELPAAVDHLGIVPVLFVTVIDP